MATDSLPKRLTASSRKLIRTGRSCSSTMDRQIAIAKDFAARYPEKIRYVEHTMHANRGMSASRNLGLKHAHGEYISYLDADDAWRPDKLRDQVELLLRHPEVAYVYGPLELW